MEESKMSIENLVKLGWADAIENVMGWHNLEDAVAWAERDDWIVHQVGWILKETDDYILFTSQVNNASEGRPTVYSGLFKVPKPFIVYRHNLMELIPEKDDN